MYSSTYRPIRHLGATQEKYMDMGTNLRMRMAEHGTTVADVVALVGRNRVTVSRWRQNKLEIPLDAARILHANGLLDAEVILKGAA